MTGHRSFDELRNRMSPERRARNDAATGALLHEPAGGQPAIILSGSDSRTFVRALTTPVPVNDRLRETIRRYRRRTESWHRARKLARSLEWDKSRNSLGLEQRRDPSP